MFRELKRPSGAVKRAKRLGRGTGSGRGKTSGKGHKGQNSRSGGGVSPLFEGGQMPIHRRLPKRGFKNFNSKRYLEVNVSKLNVFSDGDLVDIDTLVSKKVIKNKRMPVKLLGDGELEVQNLTVKVNAASKSAIEKVEAQGGKVELV